MRSAFVKRLTELAKENSRVFLITGDLGFGVLDDFEKQFPHQFLNAGVAEQNMTGIAAGLAFNGRTVFTYSIANFPILRCLEQIRNDVCYHQANVKIVSVGGGFSYGSLGFSHHATEDLAIMRSLPEMTVVAPGDLWEASEATAALARHQGPGYLRLDRSFAGESSQPGEIFQLGKGRLLREGDDLTLVATGGILGVVINAAQELAQEGFHCRVISLHTLKPLDTEILNLAAQETGGILTIEEHSTLGGLGGAVAEALLESGSLPRVFYRIGLRDRFSTIVGSQQFLRQKYEMDELAIMKKVRELISRGSRSLARRAGFKSI